MKRVLEFISTALQLIIYNDDVNQQWGNIISAADEVLREKLNLDVNVV